MIIDLDLTRTRFDADEYAWLLEQAEALREKLMQHIDFEHLSEYLADMAASQRRELDHRLSILIQHILKCKLCSDRITVSWVLTIREQQRQISQLLRGSPSLQIIADQELGEVSQAALQDAILVTSVRPNNPDDLLKSLGNVIDMLTVSFEPSPHPSEAVRKTRVLRRRR